MTDKTTKVIVWIALIVSLFSVAISVSNSPKALSNVGAAGGMLIENYLPYVMYNDGYKSEKGIVLSGANGDITTGDDLTVTDALTVSGDTTMTGDATVNGGSLTVTTANTATSSVIVGCIQRTATSTATPIKEMLFASSSLNIDGASITAGYGGGTMQGIVLWGYGTCP